MTPRTHSTSVPAVASVDRPGPMVVTTKILAGLHVALALIGLAVAFFWLLDYGSHQSNEDDTFGLALFASPGIAIVLVPLLLLCVGSVASRRPARVHALALAGGVWAVATMTLGWLAPESADGLVVFLVSPMLFLPGGFLVLPVSLTLLAVSGAVGVMVSARSRRPTVVV